MALALQPSPTTLGARPPAPGEQNQPARVLHLELDAQTPLPRPLEDDGSHGQILCRDAEALEEDDVVVVLPAGHPSGDDLSELVDLEPVEDAPLDRLDEVPRPHASLLLRVAADER